MAAATSAAMLASAATPAFADTPQSWSTSPHVSGLQYLVVLLLIPLALALLITVLVMLPGWIHRDRGVTAETWRTEGEWFGGPRKGVEAADDLEAAELQKAASETGGASAQW
jgi:hypothetical protein